MPRTLVVMMAALAVTFGALAPAGVAGKAEGERFDRLTYGLTPGGALITFDAANPSSGRRVGPITGLAAGDSLVGIDFRPATGELYGLGRSSNLYEIAVQNGRATLRSSLKTADGAALALRGTQFGIDFNPTVDRLRVVSDEGQNLRINVDTGVSTVDGALAYGSRDRNAGARPQAVGVAYTNNDNDSFVEPALIPFDRPVATGTKLYTIDSGRDALALQDPPNDGTLKTVGRLRRAVGPVVGFDVYSFPNSQGNTASNTGYASLTRRGRTRIYRVNLRTGRAKPVRRGGRVFRAVQDIAVRP